MGLQIIGLAKLTEKKINLPHKNKVSGKKEKSRGVEEKYIFCWGTRESIITRTRGSGDFCFKEIKMNQISQEPPDKGNRSTKSGTDGQRRISNTSTHQIRSKQQVS